MINGDMNFFFAKEKLARQMQMCKTTYPFRVWFEFEEKCYGFHCSTPGYVIGLIWFPIDTKDAD